MTKKQARWLPPEVNAWCEGEIDGSEEAARKALSLSALWTRTADEMRGYGETFLMNHYLAAAEHERERAEQFKARAQRIRDYLAGKIPMEEIWSNR